MPTNRVAKSLLPYPRAGRLISRRAPAWRQRTETGDYPWTNALPAEWRGAVVAPSTFVVQREYEAAAASIIGRDEDDSPCFRSYRFALTELRSDDGEELREEIVHAEDIRSWRLRDGRWLIRRSVAVGEDGEPGRPFYCLAEEMPR